MEYTEQTTIQLRLCPLKQCAKLPLREAHATTFVHEGVSLTQAISPELPQHAKKGQRENILLPPVPS